MRKQTEKEVMLYIDFGLQLFIIYTYLEIKQMPNDILLIFTFQKPVYQLSSNTDTWRNSWYIIFFKPFRI